MLCILQCKNQHHFMLPCFKPNRKYDSSILFTLLRLPVTFISLRSDLPTLKSTAVIPPSSLNATWAGAKPTTHNLSFSKKKKRKSNHKNIPKLVRNLSMHYIRKQEGIGTCQLELLKKINKSRSIIHRKSNTTIM